MSWKIRLYYPALVYTEWCPKPHIILPHLFTFLWDLPCFWRGMRVGAGRLRGNEISQKSGQFLTLGGILLIKLLPFWLKIYPAVHGCYNLCWSCLALCKLWQVFVLEEVMRGSWSLVSSWLSFFRSLDWPPGWRKCLARATCHQCLRARELQGVLLRKAHVLKLTLIPSTE